MQAFRSDFVEKVGRREKKRNERGGKGRGGGEDGEENKTKFRSWFKISSRLGIVVKGFVLARLC